MSKEKYNMFKSLNQQYQFHSAYLANTGRGVIMLKDDYTGFKTSTGQQETYSSISQRTTPSTPADTLTYGIWKYKKNYNLF